MSFSQQIKEELVKHISSGRHCQIAELSALYEFTGKRNIKAQSDKNASEEELSICFKSENEALIIKCFTLLKKTFNMYRDYGWEDAPITKNKLISTLEIKYSNSESFIDAMVSDTLTLKACCRRAYLRGAFLAVGSVSDPEKSYHMEFVCSTQKQADNISMMLKSFEIEGKTFNRKNTYVVYIKDGSQIVETLNVMGAHVALMEFENMRILKEMRNSVNRKVNCETANINKTVSAAQKQIDEIMFLMGTGEYKNLPESLKEIAELRIEYPEATLTELGELCNPKVGKSGVNHRLRKLGEIADKVKGGEL